MFKHPPFNHFKKKHHKKNAGRKIVEAIKARSVPSFVAFGLSTFGLLFILVPILLVVSALINFEIKYNDRFYPGVFVGNISVGGQTYTEVENPLKDRASELQKNGLNINFQKSNGIEEINIPLSASGLTSDNSVEYFTLGDWQTDLQKAYNWGHSGSILKRTKEQLALLFGKKVFVFNTAIQKEAVDSLLENEFYRFLKKGVPARFSLTGNKVSISEEKIGENIEKVEVLNVLNEKLANFDTTPSVLKTHTDIPNITKTNLEPFLDLATSTSKETNLIFTYKGRQWKVAGPKIVTWLTINEAGSLGIDRTLLEDYLAGTIAKYVASPPQNSRFEIRNNELVETTPGKIGNVIDIENVLQKVKLETGTITIPIEIIEVEPKVTKDTIDKYQIKDLVGEIRTSFAGSSPDREHNIKIGVGAITGMLIAPGEEFSTVLSIGQVTEKEGYVKELVIKENKTTKEFGGGLCQIATTLFRLALNAGLSITERINHRFTVHYYDPPGLDATIYGPHPDFRFVNDTGNYLLLQAKVENKQVVMQLYGQKDGRTATVSKAVESNKIPAPKTKYVESKDIPVGTVKCTETPHDGLTTDVLYTVNYKDGTVMEKNFRSVYQPWQRVCLIGVY